MGICVFVDAMNQGNDVEIVKGNKYTPENSII